MNQRQTKQGSGRESDGRKLFDELLASKKRDYATLFGLADIFRDLGEDNDARKLLEEAFPQAKTDQEKSSVISLRSLLARSTDEEKQGQLKRLHDFQARNAAQSPAMLQRLQQAVIDNHNVFAVLMDAVRCCSLGQITNALFEVGGQYRRSM